MRKFLSRWLTKGWSEEWLKINEKNYLAKGGKSLTQPMKQSYIVNQCVSIISRSASQAPLVFRNVKTDQILTTDSPIVRLFANPNELLTGVGLISRTVMFYALYGEVFWHLNDSVGGKMPAEVWVVDPRAMHEVLDEYNHLKGWEFKGKETIFIPKDEIIHVMNDNPYNQFRGLSPLDAIDVDIKADYEAGKYSKYFFENGAIPGTVLITHEDDNSTPAELRKLGRQFDVRHKGADKAYRTAVLRGGMDLKVTGLSQNEMDFIDQRKFTRDLVLSIFGVPPSMAGFTNDINRSTSEVQRKNFWLDTIKPILNDLASTINNQLVRKIDPNVIAYFDYTKIQELQKEYKEVVETAYQLFQMGFSRNELNARFGLNFDEDTEYGDRKRVPMNLTLVENEDKEFEAYYDVPTNNDDNDDNDDNEKKQLGNEEKQLMSSFDIKYTTLYQKLLQKHEKRLHTKLKSYFFKQRSKILKNLYKQEKSVDHDIYNNINIFNEENQRLASMIVAYYMDMVKDGQEFALEMMGIDRDVILNKDVIYERVNMITDQGKGILNTVFNQIRIEVSDAINNGDSIDKLAERIKSVYNTTNSRALKIARTETSAVVSKATMLEYAENGIQYKKWSTSKDERVREAHAANGRQGAIPVMASFQNGEKHPGEHSINCRCALIPIIRN